MNQCASKNLLLLFSVTGYRLCKGSIIKTQVSGFLCELMFLVLNILTVHGFCTKNLQFKVL